MSIAFTNLRETDNKKAGLQKAVASIADGRIETSVSLLQEKLIESLPGKPFAYHAPRSMLVLSAQKKDLASAGVVARQGIGASTRFHRLTWEVVPRDIGGTWLHMAHGTPPSLFYKPTTHLFRWSDDGREAKADVVHRYPYLKGNYGFKIQAEEWYRHSGLCYGKRTEAFTVQVLPARHVFSFEGTAIFPADSCFDPWSLLGLLNSSPVSFWLNVVCAEHKAYNYVEGIPLPPWGAVQAELATLAEKGWNLQRMLDEHNTTSPVFTVPYLLKWGPQEVDAAALKAQSEITEVIEQLGAIKQEIDKVCCGVFSIEPQSEVNGVEFRSTDQRVAAHKADNQVLPDIDEQSSHLVGDLFDYLVGAAFGRWDYRFAKGDIAPSKLPSAFDALPQSSPGTLDLHLADGDYIIAFPNHGILVDAREHVNDAVTQIQKVIHAIWGDSATGIEQQLATQLAVSSLGDYLGNQDKYFNNHLKRHSKGRRYAPIYWPLSVPSGSFTLWLYYHRLTDQTLYTCVNDFVEPRLKQVAEVTTQLRSKSNRSSDEEEELQMLSDLELELKDFTDELLRLAKFWKPNLNDGVQITAAPLWKLFQHKAWQNRLKETWEKLEAGEYDWAHLALSIWPDRVVRASHKDRSYAIAHDLEDELWEEVEVKKKTRGGKFKKVVQWRPRELSDAELTEIAKQAVARDTEGARA